MFFPFKGLKRGRCEFQLLCLLVQLLANEPRTAAEDKPSDWAFVLMWETWILPGSAPALVVIWEVNQLMENISPFLPLSLSLLIFFFNLRNQTKSYFLKIACTLLKNTSTDDSTVCHVFYFLQVSTKIQGDQHDDTCC